MRKLSPSPASDLAEDNPAQWRLMPTLESIIDVRGLGDIKAAEIAKAAPELGQLVDLVASGQIKNFAGRVVTERIRHRLDKIGVLDESAYQRAKKQTKTDFLMLHVLPWLGRQGLHPVERSPKYTIGSLTFEIDFLCQKSDGSKVAVMAKRSLDRPSLLDAAAILACAQHLQVADRYAILSVSKGAYATDLGDFCEVHFVDQPG